MDDRNGKLFTIASRGYPDNGVGSEVGVGEGLIGMVARAKRALRLSAMDHSLRYARAVRDRAQAAGGEALCREIPLPGLPDAAAQIAVPLVTRGRLIGVMAIESEDPLAFMVREDTLLTILAAQLATGIEHLSRETDDSTSPPSQGPQPSRASTLARRTRQFCFSAMTTVCLSTATT